jgi:hypothetical protein
MDLINIGTKLLREGHGKILLNVVAIVFMCGGSSSRYFYQDKFLTSLNIQN